jgi:phosphoserine phosphatase RsbU/P
MRPKRSIMRRTLGWLGRYRRDAGRNRVEHLDDSDRDDWDHARTTFDSSTAVHRHSLKMWLGERPGDLFPLDKDEFVIGRDVECDIVLSAEQVSKRHARVFRVSDAFYIEDLKSTNSTKVGGVSLSAPHRLGDDDVIKIGKFTLVYSDIVAPRAGTTILGTIDLPAMASDASRHRAEEKLRVISEIAGELIGVLDLSAVLARVLDELFRIFPQVDRGFVLLGDEAGDSLRIRARKLSDAEPGRSMPSRTVYDHVMGQGTAILCENVEEIDFLASPSVGMSRVASIMCAPLLDRRRRPVGVIQVDTQDPSRTFAHDDLDFLVALAGTISVAVESARMHEIEMQQKRLEQEARDARDVQRNFLPEHCPDIAGYEFWDEYRPARFVGGDYLDYLSNAGPNSPTSEETETTRWAIVLGDVSGKGMPAALLMARIATEFRLLIQQDLEPARIASILNKGLYQSGMPEKFMTLLLVRLDVKRHELLIVNAGHMDPMVRRAGGQIETIGEDQAGPPLGVFKDPSYLSVSTPIGVGEVVLLYTDGVNEALSPDREAFGMERLKRCLESTPGGATALGAAIQGALEEHTAGRDQYDDITLICFGRVSRAHLTGSPSMNTSTTCPG